MEQKTKLKQIGDREWKEKIEKVAQMMKKEEEFKWEIGDEAKDIPSEAGKRTDQPHVLNTKGSKSLLEQFAIDVAEKMNKPTDEDYYNRISMYRNVSNTFKPSERILELTWTHHFIAHRTDNPIDWIRKAKDNKWKTTDLIVAIRKETGIEINPIQMLYGRFNTTIITQENVIEELLKISSSKIEDELTKNQLEKMFTDYIIYLKETVPLYFQFFEGFGLKPEFYDDFKKKIEGMSGELSNWSGLKELFGKIKPKR